MNKTQIALVLAILSLASFYAWSKVRKIETTEREFQEARYYPEVEEMDVESISVISREPEFRYTLKRRGDQWFIDSHLLNLEKTHQVVNSILELTREREMEAEPTAESAKEFRLDDPSYRITVTANGNKDLGTVLLGKRTPDYNHFYGQWEKGGAISTVPAYTLGSLEDEPKDLRELSLFPVEVAAVDVLAVGDGVTDKVVLERQDDKSFVFKTPELGRADESKVQDFLFQLKDLKLARFLGQNEEAPSGAVQVQYRALVSYSDFEVVTEIQQRVPANPKLVYGRRYSRKKGETVPAEGTVERFVVELLADSDVEQPSAGLFEDRRVIVLDLDDVESVTVESSGKTIRAKRDKAGLWQGESSTVHADQVSGLLFQLKDLRYVESVPEEKAPPQHPLLIRLTRKSQPNADLRFGLDKKGNPYFWRQSEVYSLSDSSWHALEESVGKLIDPQPAATKNSD